ncbi:MAG TPA: LysM domain-containing protein, partial [Flavobacterium sp.]|nr:LysM domain-containing protein [Flavobacterium sp.]
MILSHIMKYYLTLLSFVFFISSNAFSQEKVVKYKVSSGETINQIAQKFKVTPYDIYQLNPDARNGLTANAVLLIPTKTGEAKKEVAETKTATA